MPDEPMNDEMKEIVHDFLVESQEVLEGLDQRFVAFEEHPDDVDLLNEIFRAAHSLKGAAGFLGFNRLVEVAHKAESILNKMRQHEIAVERSVIDVILEAVDVFKLLLADIKDTGTDSHVDVAVISAKLAAVLQPSNEAATASEPSSLPNRKKKAAKGKGRGAASAASGEGKGEAEAPKKLGAILVQDGAVTPEQLTEALAKQDETVPLGQILVQDKVVTEDTLDKALKKQGPKPSGSEEEQTIRVETRRLDQVINLVGELVLSRNRIMKLGGGLEQTHEADPLVREFSETLGRLDLVTTDLQSAVMKTRMLPIRKVLAKFPRMVRDLANKVGKKVNLQLVGEETELDKSVIEEIGDPLIHLIRNAVDHGLETPVERRAAGKPETGTVRLEALQEGDRIIIRISDDGRGIALEKVKAKALARGLVTAQELSTWGRGDIINLIFQPGFSTADQVTDVSGRGVGMDVVRTNISRINGTLEVDTEEGRGSTVTIKLPLTIAIIQALMVEVERQVFAIPLTSVVEAVKLGKGDLKTINGREVLTLRDRVLPLLRLSDAFEIPMKDAGGDRGFAVVVALGDRRLGIVVDRLQAQEEVVIKSLGEFLGEIPGVAGATITGEGKVVLILDMAELVQTVQPPGVGMGAI
jgi:two-component system chemotaxis sensor kinase CheA